MNISNALKEGNKILSLNKIKSSRLDCEILMSRAIQKDRKFIILNLDFEINQKDYLFFKDLIKQRSIGKPIAYLIGKKYFWKDEFEVSKGVLIPRPDTEVIIEEVLKIVKSKKNQNILDIGVGSGCILLSIIKENKNFYGTGIDISKECIEISKKNSLRLGLINRVKFFKSDVDNYNYGKYDLIISNPPYINQFNIKYLEKDVVCFEPKKALYGGLDGLSEIRKVISKASELIKKNGKLVLEMGFDQKDKVKNILNNKGFYINRVQKDYAQNNRCIVSTKL